MDFHKSATALVVALIMMALGGLGTVLVVGWFFEGGRMNLIFLLSPVLLVGGIVSLIKALRPFQMRVDERGLLLKVPSQGVDSALPWQAVAGLTIEHKPGAKSSDKPFLVVWPVAGAPIRSKAPVIRRNGWSGLPVVQVDELKEPVEQLAGALQHYAGPRFTSARA
ncbi:hypothetical protein HUO13_36220 [Saccharopolyspora erythraea]|uniref:hypothetical protein n=1 Tax=Saccharopolyspora erythraea TaxID=1836 RepID=UPI001BA6C96C|nr:hypothetical protein [Saccharopolyspora erythraea]QUH05506.1 hypothetical protein HUO13_36220 [Saccharopolyspora erythraea]